MVPSIRTSGVDDCTASYSRADDWHACCARVMGYEEWEDDQAAVEDTQTAATSNCLQVTNLLPTELFEDDDNDQDQQQSLHVLRVDPWTENALNIQADLERMAQWIQSKKWSFISFDSMRDDEASLIQSTVTSFAATTANEIESLRKMATAASDQQQLHFSSSNINSNAVHHRTGIVQILFARLKEDIVEPFGVLQKHRSRQAVSLWQNPLQCKLLVKPRPAAAHKRHKNQRDNELDAALGLMDDLDDDDEDEGNALEKARREQRFLPSRDTHKGRNDFMGTYQRDDGEHVTMMKRPKSLIRDPLSVLSSENEAVFDPHKNKSAKDITSYNPSSQRPTIQSVTTIGNSSIPDYHQVTQDLSEATHQQMQQEALLLQSMVTSDLDSVQKMEQQMVSITTLLTQFSELVSEQQEEVWQIHDTAKETKDNMDKGQDALVNAAEQSYQSNHYMAKGVFAMGCLLLLFHWLRP